MLPRIFNQQDIKQQIGMVAHVVPVRKAAVPEEFGEKGLRELRILPTAILQQFESLFAYVCVLNQLLDVTGDENEILVFVKPLRALQSNLVRFNSNSSASGDSGKS